MYSRVTDKTNWENRIKVDEEKLLFTKFEVWFEATAFDEGYFRRMISLCTFLNQGKVPGNTPVFVSVIIAKI